MFSTKIEIRNIQKLIKFTLIRISKILFDINSYSLVIAWQFYCKIYSFLFIIWIITHNKVDSTS